MNIADAVKFFGHPPTSKPFDAYLTSIGIHERPDSDEDMDGVISRKDQGFFFNFSNQIRYEKWRGKAAEDGEVIFCEMQVFSARHEDGAGTFQGELPFGFTFHTSLQQVKQVLGEPDKEQSGGETSTVYTWRNVNKLMYSIWFLEGDNEITCISIEPTQLRFL